MTTKFDQLSEGFLKGLGSTISSAANMAQKAYNFPGKAIGALNQVVQQGDISPITGAAQKAGENIRQMGIPKLKANDKVRLKLKGLGNQTTGIEGTLSPPEKYQNGELYSIPVRNNPRIGMVKIYSDPQSQESNIKRMFYYDTAGRPLQARDLKGFYDTNYVAWGPQGQKEWVVADDESSMLPSQGQQQQGQQPPQTQSGQRTAQQPAATSGSKSMQGAGQVNQGQAISGNLTSNQPAGTSTAATTARTNASTTSNTNLAQSRQTKQKPRRQRY